MANVRDVAAYILSKQSPMTTMKLQKLVYYSKAWHLVWEGRPLFSERIEAWANGPVVPELYREHVRAYTIASLRRGNAENLTPSEKESVDVVLQHYGPLEPYQLSDMTHRERPWREARGNTPPGERSSAEITDDALYEYYDGLVGLGPQS